MEKIHSFKPFHWEQHAIHQVWKLISFFVFLFKPVFISVGGRRVWACYTLTAAVVGQLQELAVSICSVSLRNWAQALRLGGECLYLLSHLASLLSSFPDYASWSVFCRSPNRASSFSFKPAMHSVLSNHFWGWFATDGSMGCLQGAVLLLYKH